ncbi:uncharacterized protein F5Z01DRAFT_667091 [Emericellopsis atlantica]|uniref:MI domain-containing protein n=1 Tax=Emericellopsis atlantica TaxID=2614577 RepID=A0A9P7ZE68_9HYPO|nr:uncharacterized protein F5Z01DRAFT_667091 [Emericellopsis atlantica]KAG9250147.1 hypothetical protein F5Z01DRAFT_667091 [Emericellopsis atlantica]
MPKSVAELQGQLFKSLGVGDDRAGNKAGRGQSSNRKDQRKAQRIQKKTNRYSRVAPTKSHVTNNQKKNGPTPRSRQQRVAADSEESLGEDDDEDIDDIADPFEESDEFAKDDTASKRGNKMSSAMKEKLAKDDAEIDEFERKLGIKKGRKSLPQSFKEDGLEELMADLAGGSDGDDAEVGVNGDEDSSKRKREFDDWLAAKRRKTAPKAVHKGGREEDERDSEDELNGHDDLTDLDDEEGSDMFDEEDEDQFDEEGSFGGFGSSEDEAPAAAQRPRENPYVAPTQGNVVAKYVPPSLRKTGNTHDEKRERLRKQAQGLINRLTDANIISIVKGVDDLYGNNARGEVTEVLTDLILAQVCKPEALPDQFFVLTGGFCAAVYKIIGSSFGSHLVRRVVQDFGQEYDRASAVQGEDAAIPKEPSNLITFLSQLYVFEVVRCKIIFDYMERLLLDLNEINVELLLRICRNGGRLLRRDDPQALKRVADILGKSVAKAETGSVTVRTKFMVETINDLKNKKSKGKGLDSSIVSEQVISMKKHLGELKSQSRRLDGLTPMGMDLEDVISADTKGKWWLVGASVPPKEIDSNKSETKSKKGQKHVSEDYDANEDEEDMDFVLPDYPKKARSQGLGSPAQIAIFTALMTAMDCQTGYQHYVNLGLKREEKREVARVLVQCVGSEAEYNAYYAGIGELCCRDTKLRFAFQARLWQIFRAMGESLFGEEAEDMDTADSARFQDEPRVQKVAQFYASLIASGSLSLAILKPLNMAEMEPWTSFFVECLIISLLQECKSKRAEREDIKVEKAFGAARELPQLAAGLEWFMRKKLRKTKALSSKSLLKLDQVKGKAMAAVQSRGVLEE